MTEKPPHVLKILAWLREAEQQPGYVDKMNTLLRALNFQKVHRVSDLTEEQARAVYLVVTA